MYLFLLLVIFAVLGYLIAKSRIGDKVDQTAGSIYDSSREFTNKSIGRWSSYFNRRQREINFLTWMRSDGTDLLPEEFMNWLIGLTDGEANDFYNDLTIFTRGFGLNIESLVNGGLDQDPVMRQVFVETIVIYSDAYRKAKNAQDRARAHESEKTNKELEEKDNGSARDKNRRKKQEPVLESTETIPAA